MRLIWFLTVTPRALKYRYGFDHQASPRQDIAKYGDAAVNSGKITQKQLDMVKRNDAAHANSVENFTLLVAAMGFATIAGVRPEIVNRAGLVYTVARIAYCISYILIADDTWAVSRALSWWAGNGSCFWLLWEAAKYL
jgi:uncharacterized MAPEG superfamily protein